MEHIILFYFKSSQKTLYLWLNMYKKWDITAATAFSKQYQEGFERRLKWKDNLLMQLVAVEALKPKMIQISGFIIYFSSLFW